MQMVPDGEFVTTNGHEFVVHMNREALGDLPMGQYNVTVTIKTFVPQRERHGPSSDTRLF